MAEKAGDIIKDALGEISALGAEAPVEAVDAQLSVRYLNRMMTALDADGIDLGYTEIDSLGDDVTTPAGSYEGITVMLAARLWRHFADDAPIPMDLLARAQQGKETLRKIAVIVSSSEHPDTLPRGSGNEGDNGYDTSHFYPDLEDTILAETNGSIGLEESTE
jgi:hypothetical protein